ncbi:MAG: phytanoyl-CoA dioxygenase family protein [Spirochaetes bacterium]|nr:phytanoyl-CoA dioxygenase family protein [Spirochaetota bacterium]
MLLTASPTLPTSSMSLPESAVERYRREGWVKVDRPIFAPEKFRRLKEHFEAKLAALPPGERPEGMDVPHFTDLALFEWLLAPELLDLVEPLIGPDIALFSSHFICKPRGNGKRVPWHEDSAYWRGMIYPAEVVTVWLAIDPSNLENGCMQVIPGTHRNGYSDYDPVDPAKNVFATEVRAAQMDASKRVPVELEANQASLHDGRIIHGSDANTSDKRRCGYTMRFMPARLELSQAAYAYHQIFLARGEGHGVNRYGDPARARPDLVAARTRGNKNGH